MTNKTKIHKTSLPEINDSLLDLYRETFFFDGVFSFDIKYLMSIGMSSSLQGIVYDAGVLKSGDKTYNGSFVRHSVKGWLSLLNLNKEENYGIFPAKHHDDIRILLAKKYNIDMTDETESFNVYNVDINDDIIELRHQWRKEDFVDITLYEEVSNTIHNKQLKVLSGIKLYYPEQNGKTTKYYMTASISQLKELAETELYKDKLSSLL